MVWQAAGVTITWLAMAILLIAVSNWLLVRRKDCISELNVTWFAFSFALLIWWALQFILGSGTIEPSKEKLYLEITRSGLTDPIEELWLVGAVIFVAIVPQLLTYILSGLAGTASTPKLVWQFEKIAIWSLIKFLAVAGGITVAEAFLSDYEEMHDHLVSGLRGLTALGLAFTVAVTQ